MKSTALRRLLLCLSVATTLVSAASCRDLFAPQAPLTPEPSGSIAGALIRSSGLQVEPAGPLRLFPGDTVRLRVLQTPSAELAFTPADSSLVSVGERGLVTALKPGFTQVLIAVRTSQERTGAVQIRIGSRGKASIAIDSLVGSGADRSRILQGDSVAGKLRTVLRFERGDAVRLELLIDSTVACARDLDRTSPDSVPIGFERAACEFDTARFDSISGAALFRNGEARLTSRLIGSPDRVLASSQPYLVRLANRDTMVARVVGERSRADEAGRVWFGGALHATAFPVVFGAGGATDRVTFRYRTPSGAIIEESDSRPPFEVTFESTKLAGVVDEAMTVTVTSGPAGAAGLTSRLSDLRYDGRAPPTGRLELPSWIGKDIEFASFFDPDPVSDPGVGGIRLRFFAGKAGAPPSEILRSGAPVRTGGDLPESAVAAFRLAYEVCDALSNCAAGEETNDFGVDLRPPTIKEINLPPMAVGPLEDLRLDLSDDRSGISTTPLEVATLSYLATLGSKPVCGALVNGVALPGQEVGGTCRPEPYGAILPIPREKEGYYLYRITAMDQAGNRAEPFERHVLIDEQRPVLSNFRLPRQLTPGSDAVISATATDNLGLEAVEFGLVFRRGVETMELPFSRSVAADDPFSGGLTRSLATTDTIPFIRTLTRLGNSRRHTLLVDSARARAIDAAGLVTTTSLPIPSAMFGGLGGNADPFSTVGSIQLTTGTSTLCTLDCAPSDSRITRLSVQIVGSAGLSAMSRLYYFLRAPDGSITQIGSETNFSVVETGTQRTYTYSLPFEPRAGWVGRFTLFAVALNHSGDALKGPEAQIELVAR